MLIECRECKGRVSTEAFICPHCGAAVKRKRDSQNVHPFLAAIILIGSIVVMILFFGQCEPYNPPAPSPENQMRASVEFTGTQMVVKNLNNFSWRLKNIRINHAFNYETNDIVPARATYIVGALQFSKSDGTRFNPVAYKPNVVCVNATGPGGESLAWCGQ